jgi:hypothetical protein
MHAYIPGTEQVEYERTGRLKLRLKDLQPIYPGYNVHVNKYYYFK